VETKKQKLIKGVAALMAGSNLFFIILLLVALTPDPKGDIAYFGVLGFLMACVFLLIYGLNKLTRLEKMLE